MQPFQYRKYVWGIFSSTVKECAAKFERGRENVQDDPTPKSAITPEIILDDISLKEWSTKLREIANNLGTTKKRIGYDLHKELLCAR